MLLITQFSGQQVYLNPDQILKVEKTPDTTITLITGKKMVVKESCEEIVDKYIDIKRKIYSCPGGMDING
ncbi:MAG: flagellar FlbD family protein [Candidatus Muiribacteriaceae bacterium]